MASRAVILANGYTLTPYLRSVGTAFEVDELDDTTFADRNDRRFKPGLLAASLSAEGLWDHDDVLEDAIEDVLPTAVRGDVLFLVCPDGDEEGRPCVGFLSFRTSQEIANEHAELSTVTVEARNQAGRERGVVLHPLEQETVTGNTADEDEVDELASSDAGGTAHLHVTAANGIDAVDTLDVKVQDSDDGTIWADLATFTSVEAAHVSERVVVVGTVNRYLRATWTVPTDADATFIVAFARN